MIPVRNYDGDTELRIAIGNKLLNLVANGVTDPLRLRNLTVESLLSPRHRDARSSSTLRTRRKAHESNRRFT
jgi:hypothetical protein